jgi:signal transduction histidine kinase/CheY-like chemotaxis protein
MSKSTSSFESELRISPAPILAILLVLAPALLLTGDVLSWPEETVDHIAWLCPLLTLLSIGVWLSLRWHDLTGRWLTILASVVAIHLTSIWRDIPASLGLAAFPIAVTAFLISLPAAAAVAVGNTLLLVGLLNWPAAGLDAPAVAVALIATWATLGVMYAVYRSVHQLSRWLEEYFERAQCLLAEARDRRAELTQAMDDLSHAYRQLALANERTIMLRTIAEEAQKTKTAFVAKVSHELRTPLNLITGLVELMVETPEIYTVELPPEMERDLEVVLRNCKHLSGLINDVLDLTRVEAGRMTLYKEWVDLASIVDEAVTAVFPLVEKKGLALQVFVPDDLPNIYCDRTRIRQVILNLVSNAARFTEEGEIHIDMVIREQHVVTRVTDTGPGIAPEDAARIFEPFSQGAGDLWRDKGGSGLGLSISQQFVKLHYGRLWLESEVGVGSSFIFELPISPPMEHVASPGHQIRADWIWQEDAFRTKRASLEDQLSIPRVIVCDGEGGLYTQLARYLDEIEFVPVGDLSEAVRESEKCPANVLVLNANSTSEGFLPLVERAGSEIPGTLIIGCYVPAQEERAIVSGAVGYLIKPVSRAKLEEAIRGLGVPVRRVLVVDDDPDVLRMFTRMLHACDETLEVETASSGEQALERIRSTPFDVVLLDIVMPDMDGWQVLECMGKEDRMENLSVLLVSAQDPEPRPPRSGFLLASIDEGLSIKKLIRCSLELSTLFLTPDGQLDLTPPRTGGAEWASGESVQRPGPAPALSL